MKRIGQILIVLGVPTPLLSGLFQNGDVWHDFLVGAGFVMLAMLMVYGGICLFEKAYYADELHKMHSDARRERMAQRAAAREVELDRKYAAEEMMSFLVSDAEDSSKT